MKLRVWEIHRDFRFPLVRPRLPAIGALQQYFAAAQASRYYSNFGPASVAFERSVEEMYLETGSAVACSNCTSGLSAVLIALRIDGPVLVPAFTFAATFSAVRGAGLQSVVGDVDPETGILAMSDAVRLIREHGCKGVIVVRPYGIWTDISELVRACEAEGAAVIVDNAAGFGVDAKVWNDRMSPSRVEVFSLHATKPFGIGEGGLIWAPGELEHNVRSATNFGLWACGDLKPGEGINAKLDEISASTACAVLDDWPVRLVDRQSFAAVLNARARDCGIETFCDVGQEENSPWQCFAVKLPEGVSADAVIFECARSGLQVRPYYLTLPGHAYAAPAAAMLSSRAICLPVYDGDYADRAEEVWSIFAGALGKSRGARG